MTSPFWNELAKAVETVEAYPHIRAEIDLDGRVATVYAKPMKFENDNGVKTLVAEEHIVVLIHPGTTSTSTTDKVLDEKQIIGFGGKHSTDGKKR